MTTTPPEEKIDKFRSFRDEIVDWLESGVEVEVTAGRNEAVVKVPDEVEEALDEVEGL